MSEVLGNIDVNDYGLQNMVAEGGGSTEDLSTVLGTQDTLLAAQENKIEQMVQALQNKKAIDLTQATSDANATAGDIADGKTAYVNGVKVTGTVEPNDNNAQIQVDSNGRIEIVYNYEYITQRIQKLPDIYVNNRNNIEGLCSNFRSLIEMPNVYMSSAGVAWYRNSMFYNCYNLVSAKLIDMSDCHKAIYFFGNCVRLENVPVYDFSSMTHADNMYSGCNALTNESLNNIMQTFAGATLYESTKTLSAIGLSSTQATTCTTLSNWTALQNAGWTTGY